MLPTVLTYSIVTEPDIVAKTSKVKSSSIITIEEEWFWVSSETMLDEKNWASLVLEHSVQLKDVTILGSHAMVFEFETLGFGDLLDSSWYIWVIFRKFRDICLFFYLILVCELLEKILIVFLSNILGLLNNSHGVTELSPKLIDGIQV